jgi:ElaB/YqjD/DUF883 family membrane-anchored ribosome-binding protein
MADIRAQITRVRDAANDAAISATDRLKESSSKARESAGELIQTGKDKAGMAYGDARDKTQRAASRANQIVQDHPIAAVAGAVAVGAVVAWMFPKSRRVMKALPGLAATAGSKVVEAAIAARAAAADGADTVKQGASSALHAAGDAAANARDRVVDADIPARATKLADDVAALIAARVDAIGDAIKARLPKS